MPNSNYNASAKANQDLAAFSTTKDQTLLLLNAPETYKMEALSNEWMVGGTRSKAMGTSELTSQSATLVSVLSKYALCRGEEIAKMDSNEVANPTSGESPIVSDFSDIIAGDQNQGRPVTPQVFAERPNKNFSPFLNLAFENTSVEASPSRPAPQNPSDTSPATTKVKYIELLGTAVIRQDRGALGFQYPDFGTLYVLDESPERNICGLPAAASFSGLCLLNSHEGNHFQSFSRLKQYDVYVLDSFVLDDNNVMWSGDWDVGCGHSNLAIVGKDCPYMEILVSKPSNSGEERTLDFYKYSSSELVANVAVKLIVISLKQGTNNHTSWVEVVTAFTGRGALNLPRFQGGQATPRSWVVQMTGFKGGTVFVRRLCRSLMGILAMYFVFSGLNSGVLKPELPNAEIAATFAFRVPTTVVEMPSELFVCLALRMSL